MPLPTTPKPMDRASGLIRLLNLHYGTSTLENPAEWPQCLLQIQSVLNNLKTLTGRTPNEIVYGFTPNFMINYTTDPDIDLPAAQIDAADALDLATMNMKYHYDCHHTAMFLAPGDWALLRLHKGYNLPSEYDPKLSQQYACPFKILCKFCCLAYH